MSTVIVKEKVFKHFLDFPPELRKMVIEEMQPDSRCRFTRCSKLCYKEAKSSKNFVDKLQIFAISLNEIAITVGYSIHKTIYGNGFMLKFEKEHGKKYMKYLRQGPGPNEKELWRDELNDSICLGTFSILHFRNMLKFYQNIIRRLEIKGPLFESIKPKNFDFGVNSLKNLEELKCEIGILQFISKLRHPLKKLIHWGDENFDIIRKYDQIYNVRNNLYIPYLTLNGDQFFRLSASIINIHIGELTVDDICNFIKHWRSGKLRDNFQSCEWNLDSSGFDVLQLLERFGVQENDEEEDFVKVKIKHDREVWKRAELFYFDSDRLLTFYVKINDN